MKASVKNQVYAWMMIACGAILLLGTNAALISGNVIGIRAAESGRDLMAMQSGSFFRTNPSLFVSVLIYLIGSVSILQCLAGAAALITGICAAFYPNVAKVFKPVMIVTFVFTALYFVFGVCYTIAYRDTLQASEALLFRTEAYIPLVCFGILFLVFALFRKKYCRTQEGAVSAADSSGQCARAGTDLSEEQKRVEVLRLYGKLFEEGALTEEEYRQLKGRIISL